MVALSKIGSDPGVGRPRPRHHGLDDAPLDVGELRVAVAGQERLESRVALRLEGSTMTEGIPHRMRRIEVSARNPSGRHSFRGRVGAFVAQ
jgi:hypothetical protein